MLIFLLYPMQFAFKGSANFYELGFLLAINLFSLFDFRRNFVKFVEILSKRRFIRRRTEMICAAVSPFLSSITHVRII